MKRVYRKQTKTVRLFIEKMVRKLKSDLKNSYIFDCRLVGSAKWNTTITDVNGFWDLDYQIILSYDSKEYKLTQFRSPKKIKTDFITVFNKLFLSKNGFRVENSTSAITLINNNSKYSVDFVIIFNNQIIRRNNDAIGNQCYTWNKLPDHSKTYRKFINLKPEEKIDLIETYILPRKIKAKTKDKNDPKRETSYEIFLQEVNNYVARKRNY